MSVSAITTQLVKNLITQNPIFIFSKSFCPYCNGVKNLFTQLKVPFNTIELDKREDGEEIQSYLKYLTGASTVPRVFIKGEFIGGHDATLKLHNEGKLKAKLEQATLLSSL